MLRERLNQVEERIHSAVERAGRRRSEVTLIAVTKKFPAGLTLEAYALGLRHFGENYVQEFEAKHPALPTLTVTGTDAVFHLIGHLQSNKTRIAAELFQVIETVDFTALGHASKFVQPGAYRIESNSFGQGSVEDVAFQNPDGSIVLIVLNSGSNTSFSVNSKGQSFTYTLPAGAVATFQWKY